MFPYHDENQTLRPAYVTMGLIGLCVLAWIFVQGAGEQLAVITSVCNLGLVPAELMQTLPAGTAFPISRDLVCVIDPGREVQHIFTSMFLHGGWGHLLGNMWFLWLFGNNIEDSMTRPRFLVFYLACGVAAALLQVVLEPTSGIPMVGASGAISGVMGAYLVLFPRVRVFNLVWLGFFVTTVALPAWVMLIYWGLIQFFGGLSSVTGEGGVAFWAHVGGFVAGIALVKFFAQPAHLRAHQASVWQPRHSGWQ